ncbi:helix-turn-helix domain-containing protein [Streptomyces sp. NPDC048710]|uniref:helix-turn-helix domain-containing protein n=1 Tax=Streptomyces sp. NPDC048710 TaxID=3365586 RepID=UPI003713673E
MTRWQPLPDSLPREARHLVEQMRVLKGRTGLSLAELARRTAYSKSSWQRYLSGAKPPPRGAAQVLGRLAGADQARLLALWELAEQAWQPGGPEPSGPLQDVAAAAAAAAAAADAVGGAGAGPEPAGGAYGRWRTAALAAFAVIVLLVAGLLWALPRRAGDRTGARPRGVLSRAGRSRRASRGRCP